MLSASVFNSKESSTKTNDEDYATDCEKKHSTCKLKYSITLIVTISNNYYTGSLPNMEQNHPVFQVSWIKEIFGLLLF